MCEGAEGGEPASSGEFCPPSPVGRKEERPLLGVASGSSSTANGLCLSVELGWHPCGLPLLWVESCGLIGGNSPVTPPPPRWSRDTYRVATPLRPSPSPPGSPSILLIIITKDFPALSEGQSGRRLAAQHRR